MLRICGALDPNFKSQEEVGHQIHILFQPQQKISIKLYACSTPMTIKTTHSAENTGDFPTIFKDFKLKWE